MKFKAHGRLKGDPEVTARVKVDPLRFQTAVAGSCECQVGAISAHVGDIRIRTAIPFLKPRRRLPLVATVGGFNIRLKPFEVRCGTKGIEMAGVLGTEGIGAEAVARLACEMEGNVEGQLPMKSGRFHVDLDEDEGE